MRLPILMTLIVLTSPITSAQAPESFWTAPLGLTEADAMRVQVVAGEPRLALPPTLLNVCNVEVTVEVLAAADLSLLESLGPLDVSVRSGLSFDYLPEPGAPPAREEVVVRTRMVRKPLQLSAEPSLLTNLCPLMESLQIFDRESGIIRSLITRGIDFDLPVDPDK